MGFRVFVSPLQPSKAFLPSKGTRAGAAGGGECVRCPGGTTTPRVRGEGQLGEGRAGRRGAFWEL